MVVTPKYTIPEIERRWFVDLAAVGPLGGYSFQDIDDLYIAGTQLRLRAMRSAQGEVVFKFCKKYGKTSALCEPIANLYLSEFEYRVLSQLNGHRVTKRRYACHGGALDLYAGTSPRAIFEIEFASEAEASQYIPPTFVRDEITNDKEHSGAAWAVSGG